MTKSSDKSEKAGITAADFMAEARALTLEGMRKRAASNRPSALDRLNELLGQEPTIGKDEARRVTQPQPVAPAETIPMQPMKAAPLSPDEAIAAALAKSEAKKEWLAAAVAECEARDAKLSALPPDVANMARKLMGLPPRSNAPKPLTPVRGVSTPIPLRTPASATPEPASTPIEEAAAPIPASSAHPPAVAAPEPVAPPADAAPQVATWTFIPSKRETGYGADLNALLQRRHKSGKPIPTAAEVIEIWKANLPRIFRVAGGNLEYCPESGGRWKEIKERSLRKAIKDRTSA